MHRDDLVSQVRTRARLHGRNQARRVIEAVIDALQELVPPATFRALTAQLPRDIDVSLRRGDHAGDEQAADAGAGIQLIRNVGRRLRVDDIDAAFYARTTFEQLNAFCRGTTRRG